MTQQPSANDIARNVGRVALRIFATLLPLTTAAAFGIAWLHWGSDFAVVMAKTIQLEFLVIHAILFLGVFILMPVESALFRALRWVAVALLVYLYLQGGYSLFGWPGIVALVGIFVGTYGPFLVPTAMTSSDSTSRGRRIVEIAVRWVVSMFAYGLISSSFELPELVNAWTEHRAAVALGAAYFATLALFEATPLYPRIRGVPHREQGALLQ